MLWHNLIFKTVKYLDKWFVYFCIFYLILKLYFYASNRCKVLYVSFFAPNSMLNQNILKLKIKAINLIFKGMISNISNMNEKHKD